MAVRAREARAAPPPAADQQTLVQTAEMEAMEKTVEMGEMDFRRWRQRIQLCYRLTLLTGGGGGERGEDIFTSGGDGGDGGRGTGGSDGNNGEAGGAGGGGGAFEIYAFGALDAQGATFLSRGENGLAGGIASNEVTIVAAGERVRAAKTSPGRPEGMAATVAMVVMAAREG